MEIFKEAVAWFITEDDTYSGGEWELGNSYWLTHLRGAMSLFANRDEVLMYANRYKKRIETRQIVPLTEEQTWEF